MYKGWIMENRKCIAVLTEKPSLDYQSGILKGIYRSAFSHDTNVAVFCVTSTRSDEAYQIGEMVIFSLLGDYSRFSGVIYLPDTIDYSMRDTLITEKLIAASRKIKIPVVTIDGNYDEFPCFLSDDSEPIQFLVDHLSAGHGCKDIGSLPEERTTLTLNTAWKRSDGQCRKITLKYAKTACFMEISGAPAAKIS